MDENELYQEEIREDDLGDILPDGYAEGDDFFDMSTWTGTTATDSASEGEEPETGANELPATEADAPAIGQEAEPISTDDGQTEEVPATDAPENPVPSSKRRVKYQFDHQDVEEDVDLDNDLPEILQKARSVDRYKERLTGAQSLKDRVEAMAKSLKYDNAEAFLDAILDNAKASEMQALKDQGTPDAIAEDYVTRKYADASSVTFSKTEAPSSPAPADGATGTRDFAAEARELLIARPELRGKDLPAEVYAAVSEPGKTLLTAYMEYERKVAQAEAEKTRSEAEKLRKENRILKNNADSADRAPVSGVSKGGRADDKGPEDPFLKGFNSMF